MWTSSRPEQDSRPANAGKVVGVFRDEVLDAARQVVVEVGHLQKQQPVVAKAARRLGHEGVGPGQVLHHVPGDDVEGASNRQSSKHWLMVGTPWKGRAEGSTPWTRMRGQGLLEQEEEIAPV